MDLPEYARAHWSQGDGVGTTNVTFYGPCITRSNVVLGTYRDTRVLGDEENQVTAAIEARLETDGSTVVVVIRDPLLLAAMGAQFSSAAVRLARALRDDGEHAPLA
jgi:hypothetical protein